MTASPMLELDHVGMWFGGLRAVDDCSFAVGEGEMVGLVGPNGAGKSTIFNLATGYLRPSEGEVRYRGESIEASRPSVLARDGIGRTFQTPVSFPELSVIDNVLVATRLPHPLRRALTGAWRSGEAENVERALAVLDRVGLTRRANDQAGNLSGGELRMMEVARQLVSRPTLLMLDEPTAGVAPILQHRLGELVRSVHADGTTVLVVEHNLRFLLELVGRVICMASGAVIADGTPDDIRSDPQVMAAYLGARDAS